MATHPDSRVNERGLSLIEALVIVTVTAMLAALLLPMTSSVAARNFTRAEQALDATETAQAEYAFRTLLRGVVQDRRRVPEGDGASLVLFTSPSADNDCIAQGPPRPVRLEILQSGERGRLVCVVEGRRIDILVWTGVSGSFSYSEAGLGWGDILTGDSQARRGGAAPVTRRAPLVRFELANAEGTRVRWAERYGWTEAAQIEPAGAAP